MGPFHSLVFPSPAAAPPWRSRLLDRDTAELLWGVQTSGNGTCSVSFSPFPLSLCLPASLPALCAFRVGGGRLQSKWEVEEGILTLETISRGKWRCAVVGLSIPETDEHHGRSDQCAGTIKVKSQVSFLNVSFFFVKGGCCSNAAKWFPSRT